MAKRTVRLAAVQVRPRRGSVKDTIFNAIKLGAKAAVEKEPDALCYPEHWLPEYKKYPVDMDPLPALQSLAEEYGVWVVGGAYFERVRKSLYISSPFIGKNGDLVGKQYKVHLFRREKSIARPGRGYRLFDMDGAKIGIMVCYDETFPEAPRTLTLGGAEILFCPSLIVKGGVSPWHQYLSVRALENRIPIVAVNVFSPPYVPGGSVIIDLTLDKKTLIAYPRLTGMRIQGEGWIAHDVDLNLHAKLRQERLSERMPIAYSSRLIRKGKKPSYP